MILLRVRTQFIGYHRWLEAPEEVKFLRNYHRHVFHVTLAVKAEHDNRYVEFFILQRLLKQSVDILFHEKHFEFSCEQIAGKIANIFKEYMVYSVIVSEDGENEAEVRYDSY